MSAHDRRFRKSLNLENDHIAFRPKTSTESIPFVDADSPPNTNIRVNYPRCDTIKVEIHRNPFHFTSTPKTNHYQDIDSRFTESDDCTSLNNILDALEGLDDEDDDCVNNISITDNQVQCKNVRNVSEVHQWRNIPLKREASRRNEDNKRWSKDFGLLDIGENKQEVEQDRVLTNNQDLICNTVNKKTGKENITTPDRKQQTITSELYYCKVSAETILRERESSYMRSRSRDRYQRRLYDSNQTLSDKGSTLCVNNNNNTQVSSTLDNKPQHKFDVWDKQKNLTLPFAKVVQLQLEAERLQVPRSTGLTNNHGSVTPQSSPLDSPTTAPSYGHYISSMRASSRRLNPLTSPEKERDPLTRLLRFLRAFYRELAGRDPPNPPSWAPPLPPGTLCPAHFQPSLLLLPLGNVRCDALPEIIGLDQLFAAVRTSDGVVHEAPRRVMVEGGAGIGKTSLCLRLLHSWATEGAWLGPTLQLALFVPLRELRGSSLSHYLGKELLPKSALGNSNGFQQIWKCLSLLEDRLLFVLDGYDETERDTLGDALDLLEGRLLPECRVLVTCCLGRCASLNQYFQRKALMQGLDWGHVERLSSSYFARTGKHEAANRFLDIVCSSSQVLRPLAVWPLGWLLLCVLYDERDGDLPTDSLVLHQSLFKCLIRRSLIRRGEVLGTNSNDLPGHCKKLLVEFGKLALSCIKEERFVYTDIEIRSHCRGGGLDVTELGFLTRGLNFGRNQNKKRAEFYTPLHRTFAEFLAAFYISSVVHYANILRRELDDILGTGPVSDTTVTILKFLLGLLNRKGYLVFNQLCPLDLPTRTLFSLLQSAGPSELNVAAICRLIGASGSSRVRTVPLVHTAPLELDGWSQILRSNSCTVESLELVFQFDKGSDSEALLDDFFDALSSNDSVRSVKVSSLLGQDFSNTEVERLARYIQVTLAKTKLYTFELVITCLEDTDHDRFQILVDSLCLGLKGCSSSLSKLVLDLNLGVEQVHQLCQVLQTVKQVSVLHLPHLGCGREGLKAVADLIRIRPLVALNLTGSWGTKKEDPPSSSGASVVSGSGSCGLNTLGHGSRQGAVSPKAPGGSYYFSSLPRGVMGGHNSLSRPATLPRQPLQTLSDGFSTTESKRNSDSVLFQRLFHPMPTCDTTIHTGAGFHDIFEAARDPDCRLRSLNVSKCLLVPEDALCLGETVRRSKSLDALRLEGGTRLGEVLPVLLGLAENSSLQLLDLGSPRLILEDGPTQLVCQALSKNNSLRLLSLDGWTFRIEEEGTLGVFLTFLQTTSVRDLVLSNVRLHLAVHGGRLARLGRGDDTAAELLAAFPDFACSKVFFLRLSCFQVTVNDRSVLYGPLLLPFLRGFTSLSDLDLSLEKISSPDRPVLIDDKTFISFFQTLSVLFRSLQSLKICYWRVNIEDVERTLRTVGRSLKSCSLSHLDITGLVANDPIRKISIEHLILQTFVSGLSYLCWLGAAGVCLNPGAASALGKCIRDRFSGTVLEINAKDISAPSVKELVTAISEGSKVDVSYLGGSNCNLRIQRLLRSQKSKGKLKKLASLKD